MTSLWLTLLFKSTFVLAAAAAAAACLRSRPAAVRHLVWLAAFGTLLLLPAGLLIPQTAVPAVLHVGVSTAASDAPRQPGSGLPWIGFVWFAGTVVCMVRLSVSACRCARLVRNSRPEADRVRITEHLSGPASWSFGRGSVLLPVCVRTWPQAVQQAAIRHEFAHLQRHDSEALLIGELACALYWFHPMAWYALGRLRAEAEHAADDAVLACGTEPAEYAEQLLSAARGGMALTLLAGAGEPSTLAARIRAVLDPNRRRTVVTRRMWAVALAAAVAVALPLAATQAGERKVYKVSEGGITPPEVIRKTEPKYTPEAKEAKIQGSVKLSAVVEPDGKLSTIVVEHGIDPGLDANAMEAVATWLMKPARKDGEPVPVKVSIEIDFRLVD